MSHLTVVGDVADPGGMASTVLAEAIGYPGSSVAFAQLLSGMERSGLIEREVRGKRTYRISPAESGAPRQSGSGDSAPRAGAGTTGSAIAAPRRGPAAAAQSGGQHAGRGAGRAADGRDRSDRAGQGGSSRSLAIAEAGGADLDYDELARRLLLEVVQRLAVSPGDGPGTPVADGGEGAGPAGAGQEDAALQEAALQEAALQEAALQEAALQETVADLEQKLASVQSNQRRLTAENAKLREQLKAAQLSLAEAQQRDNAAGTAGRFDSTEVLLLERLLSPLRDQADRHREADAG
jgi:hypothetical protein